MSRMSDQAKWNERNRGRTTWSGRQAKGIKGSPKKVKAATCKTCHHAPCTNSEECRRARGEVTYQMRRENRQARLAEKADKALAKARKKADKKKKKEERRRKAEERKRRKQKFI